MAYLEYRPTQTLYQYCSWDAFLAITASKQLRFTGLDAANDPREIHLGLDHFIEALRSVRGQEYRGARGDFLEAFENSLLTYRGNSQLFSACFSLNADELPMWGAYGANYGGLAIGFRPGALFDLPARCQKVRYLNEGSPSEFRKLALEIASILPEHRDDDLARSIKGTVNAIAAISALKHNSWSYEREIRFVHGQPRKPQEPGGPEIFKWTGLMPDGQPILWTPPLERAIGSRTAHYLEYPFGKYRNGGFHPARAIKEVVVGPNCEHDPAEFEGILSDRGYGGFRVIRSECSIRLGTPLAGRAAGRAIPVIQKTKTPRLWPIRPSNAEAKP